MAVSRKARVPQRAAADPPEPAARLDGRRAHVLDRAAEYVRLADQGHTAAQIARRRRKSAGHVSILLRLGRALATVPEGERAALRSPRVTWRLVQRLVRTDVDPASLRKQLRDAVGGFSTHNVDGRSRRGRRPKERAPGTPAPGVAWGWDATWFANDPTGYAAAHVAHLTHVHRVVSERAAQAVRARATGALASLDTGQSLRGLQRRLLQAMDPAQSGPAATLDEERALAAFAALGRALHAADEAARTLLDRAPDAPPTAASAGAESSAHTGLGADTSFTADELADDLDEP